MRDYRGRRDLIDTLKLGVVVIGLCGLGVALTHCKPVRGEEAARAALTITATVVDEVEVQTFRPPQGAASATVESTAPFHGTVKQYERADGSLVTITTFSF